MRLLVIFTAFAFMFPIWSMDPPRTLSKDTILADLLEKFPALKMDIETWGEEQIVKALYKGHDFKGYEIKVKSILSKLNLQENKTDFSEFSPQYICLIHQFETNKIILKNLFSYLQNNSKDNPELQNLLGIFYNSGKGGVQSSEEALKHLRAAARDGSYYAMYNYYRYLSASPAIENKAEAKRAFEFLNRAAKALAPAMYTLSLLKMDLKDAAPAQSKKVDESGSREDQSEMALKPTKYLQPRSERTEKVDESGSREDQSELPLNPTKYLQPLKINTKYGWAELASKIQQLAEKNAVSVPSVPTVQPDKSYETESSEDVKYHEPDQYEKVNNAYQKYMKVHSWTARDHEKNIEDAVALMERAASAQCAEAQYTYYFIVEELGWVHLRNRAIQYLHRAAENGHQNALQSLTDAYSAFPNVHGSRFKKEGIEPNYDLATRYNLFYALQENIYSIGLIGQMMAEREGLEQNRESGMILLKFAEEKNCPNAAYYLMKKYLRASSEEEAKACAFTIYKIMKMIDLKNSGDALQCAENTYHLMKGYKRKARLCAYTVHKYGLPRQGADESEDIYRSEIIEAVKLIKEYIPGYYLSKVGTN